MPARKIHLNRESQVAIICPGCGGTNRVPVDKLKGYKKLQVKCACGHLFPIEIAFKRAYRKRVKLSGSYANLADGGEIWLAMQVLNLSKTGLGFSVPSGHGVRQGDKLKVEFTLHDDERTTIEATAVAVQVEDRYIGCFFIGYMQQNHNLALDSLLRL